MRFAFAGSLALAFLLRVLFPLADPPPGLDWSTGSYTDPAAVTHSARNTALFGEREKGTSRDYVFYPLLNWITYLVYEVFGVSRLATEVLSAVFGTATVAAMGWAVTRCRGKRAGVLATLFLAIADPLVMVARLPIAENLAGLLLSLSAGLSFGASAASLFFSGFFAAGAALFGKLHAVAFSPALLLFFALRRSRPFSFGPILGGFVVAFLLWLVLVYAPNREAFAAQVREAPKLYGDLAASLRSAPIELFRSVRSAWLFHRMPVMACLGAVFLVATLVPKGAWRRGAEDGSLLFALWFFATWCYHAVLPYKAPRYYALAALPLVAGAAMSLDSLRRRVTLALPAKLSIREKAALALAVFAIGTVLVDCSRHWASAAGDLFRVPRSKATVASEVFFDSLAVFLYRFPVLYGISLAATPALTIGILRQRHRWEGLSPPRLGRALLAAAVATGVWPFVVFSLNPRYAIEDAKQSIARTLPEGAVVLGSFAPALLQDTILVCVPQFGAPDPRAIERFGVTHVVLAEPGDPAAFDLAYPGLRGKMTEICRWPVPGHNVRAVTLSRIAGEASARLPPSEFEQGVLAMAAGNLDEALKRFGKMQERGTLPDAASREAQCLYLLGRTQEAIAKLEEAILVKPHPEDCFNLGNLLLREGRSSEARRIWERGLALDPHDETMWTALRDLNAREAR
jgi:pentatricopeptide repeat protein